MKQIPWINLIHIYQPPTQHDDVIRKVAEESYGPLARGLKDHPNARMVVNINGVLTQSLDRLGYGWILQELRDAALRRQVEFTGSAMYHAILPLLPAHEIARQIRLNAEVNRHYFGDAYTPSGFFPPEMCYSHSLGEILIDAGFEWVALDEIGFQGRFEKISYDKVYTLSTHEELALLFRDRSLSDGISMYPIEDAGKFRDALFSERSRSQKYIFTAMDGETYGHHKKDFDKTLFELYDMQDSGLVPMLASELLELGLPREEVDPVACSWSSSEQDIKDGIPYGLWRNVNNEIHNLQWALTDLAIEASEASHELASADQGYKEARKILDKGLHSCQYWWASGKRGWGTISVQWMPRMILAGAQQMRSAIELFPGISDRYKGEAERLYALIKDTVDDWDRNKKYKVLYAKEEEV